ncbi:tetratricopeptide repeat protein [Brevundimonas sp. SL161]|uniref:tetratricopeptide repeat protein n=1 Tax=Brevundimonas sp. SL161 TaxID=2804613 RepID=UPI003CF00F6D
MAGPRSSTAIGRTTAALGVAGTIALAPIAGAVVPAFAQEAAAALDPITIRVGANDGFTRIEFAGIVGSRSRVRRDGQTVVVRIGSTAAPDVSRLKVDPPPGVAKVETRAALDATELVITLAEGSDARTGSADGAVWLNLYPAGAAPAAPAGAAVPAGGAVPVIATKAAEQVNLSFAWGAPVGAAVFRRGDAVWVVFDTAARMDMSKASDLGVAGDARWAVGPDYTAIRISAPEALSVSAKGEGATWTVTIGGPTAPPASVVIDRDDTGDTALVASMAGATRTVWLTDPMVGDRFAAVTALAPGKGFADTRRTIDLTLLPTAQGMAIETPTDDLSIKAEGDLVTLSRPGGLLLSPPSMALEAAEPAHAEAPGKAKFPALILSEWGDAGEEGFSTRYRKLQDAAALEAIAASDNPRAPIEARLALTRFLVGSGLGFEAIGVVNAMFAKTPSLQGEPELRGLRGAARASIGRLEEATLDFSSGALAGDPSTKVWQGWLAAERGDWGEARRAFAGGAAAIDDFPPIWRARFGAAHAMAALETGDLDASKSLLAYSFSQEAPAADQLVARLVQARLFELEGATDRALAVYKAIGRAPLDGIATPAKLGVIRIELAKGTLTPTAAAAQLEQLKWRWRGDATELSVIRTLGGLYLSQGRYREALDALRGAGKRLGDLPGAVELQTDLSNAFRALFLDGAADGLQPVQALALFYDFRDLTPVGADGDEMVRRLARRLVDVDLLDQAAELLKYQVDNRLEGVAKAQVATTLATVLLMDRQPEPALQAIWASRTTLLPTALNAERRALEARALMDLGRYDHALETLADDRSAEAQQVRADIFWKQENWAGAAALYESRLGDRYKDTATALTPAEESQVIRAGVGYSLARDAGALSRLSRNYAPFKGRARSAAALRIALDGLDGMEGAANAQDFAGLTAGADTFTGWVNQMKTQLREKTGGNRAAATPARPTAPAAAAPAAG